MSSVLDVQGPRPSRMLAGNSVSVYGLPTVRQAPCEVSIPKKLCEAGGGSFILQIRKLKLRAHTLTEVAQLVRTFVTPHTWLLSARCWAVLESSLGRESPLETRVCPWVRQEDDLDDERTDWRQVTGRS